MRLVFQSALEAEVTEFFGRERYARGEREHEGSRNGYSPMTIKTTAGEVTLARPKTRGTDVAFASRLLGSGDPHQRTRVVGVRRVVRGCRCEMSRPPSSTPWEQTRPSPSRPSAGCASRSRPSSTPGGPAAWPTSSSTTCSPAAAISACTRGPRPSPCWWRGGSRLGKTLFLGLEPGNAESTDARAGFLRGLTA